LSQKGAQIEKMRRNMWKCREGEDEMRNLKKKKMNTSWKKREKEN
jgi:hypothetical protein